MSILTIERFILSNGYCRLECMDIEGVHFIPNEISVKKFLNQSTSFPADSKTINSDSMVDRVIKLYLDDFQNTTPLPRIKI
jgi:hypothetical protein